VSVGRGDILHLRLFICGVEVPVIGAMVSATEGSPAAAQIEIIPTDRGLQLFPRSKVHLFFLDYDEVSNLGHDPTVADHGRSDPSRTDQQLRSSYYKLLFSGEIFTINYTKTGFGSRSMVLQCLDDSNLWDTSYLYMLRYASGGPSDTGDGAYIQNRSSFAGAFEGTDDILTGPELLVSQWASRETPPYSPSLIDTGGLIGGLFSVLELIGGLKGKFVGITGWHTIQEARVRLMDQCIGDSGAVAESLYDATVFENWLASRIGDRGTVISFRDIINLINEYIFYGVVPNPVGKYRRGARSIPDWPANMTRGVAGLDPEFRGKVEAMIKTMKEGVLEDGEELNQAWPGTRINSGFRSVKENDALREQGAKTDEKSAHLTGFAVDIGGSGVPDVGFMYGQSGSKNGGTHARFQYYQKEEGYEEYKEVLKHLTSEQKDGLPILRMFFEDLRRAAKGQGLTHGLQSTTKNLYCDAVGMAPRRDPVHVQWTDGHNKYRKTLGGGFGGDGVEEYYQKIKEEGKRERLSTQYFRPDCWFVSPPLCNVVFPEEVNSFSFTRQMMRETTRLQLMTHNVMIGESALLNQSYFAPNFVTTPSLTEEGKGSVKRGVLYPHEKYSGIIPKLERISDIAIYSRISADHRLSEDQMELDVSKETGSKEAGEELDAAIDDAVTFWAARTAAFNFLSHRYASRMGIVSGRFMPRIACGFPALIIDKPSASAAGDANAQIPTHFLGMVRSLSHSLSQSGGTTTITLSHARSHHSYDATDGLPNDLFSIQERTERRVSRKIEVSRDMDKKDYAFLSEVYQYWEMGIAVWDYLFFKGMTGPNGGIVTDLVLLNVNGAHLGEGPVEKGPEHQIEGEDTVYEKKRMGCSELLKDPVPVHTSGVTFTEVFPVAEGQEGKPLPLEDALSPPWFTEEYQNAGIGTLYKDFFGCDSIVSRVASPSKGDFGSVEGAVNWISSEYSKKSGGGFSASNWIYNLTSRGYASLPEVLGDIEGGLLGFHEYAVGNRTELSNLELEAKGEPAEGQTKPELSTQFDPEDIAEIPKILDPREPRHARAKAYRRELLRFRGLRG